MAKTGSCPEPVKPLHATLIEWGKHKSLHRVHNERFKGNAFNATEKGNARFSPIFDHSGAVIPTLYAGSTLACALMETVFHDVPYSAGFKWLPLSILDLQVHSVLTLNRDLVLVDLGSVALHKLGIRRAQLIDTMKAHYAGTRRWAEALYEQFPKSQGLRWTSRQDDRAHAVVLFGNRIKSNAIARGSDSMPLIRHGEAILPVLDLALRLGVHLAE